MDPRADELPEHLRTREGRRAALREAKKRLDEATTEPEQGAALEEPEHAVSVELDPEQFVTRSWGRRNWLREARRGLDEQRELQARPIARSRAERLQESARRLSEELATEQAANAAYEAYRAHTVMKDGRRLGGAVKPYQPPAMPAGRINTTDHDSRIVGTAGQPTKQGYNAQAAVNERQVVIAAEITVDSPDFGHLEPMVKATVRELENAGVSESPGVVLADPGYWHQRQMEHVVDRGIQVLIPPDSGLRKGARPGWEKGLYAFVRRVLETDHGEALYRKQ